MLVRANYNKSNYTVTEFEDHVLLTDLGPWDEYVTITNAAEQVVKEVFPLLKGRRLDYLDSDGNKATLNVKQGKFASFSFRSDCY